MKSYKVTFLPSNKVIEAEETSTIFSAAQQAGLPIDAFCGGRGTCGKCKVQIVKGECPTPTIVEQNLLSKEELQQNVRLACTTRVSGSCTVSLLNSLRQQEYVVLAEGKGEQYEIDSSVKRYRIRLIEGTFEDDRDDVTRLKAALAEQNPGLTADLSIEYSVLQHLAKTIREDNGNVEVLVHNGKRIMDVRPAGKEAEQLYGIALDIGTTTIAAYLCDLEKGTEEAATTRMNPQIPYGDDVISRISYAVSEEDGLKTLTDLIRDAQNSIIRELTEQAGITSEQIMEMVIVSNTVMGHIALGISPESIGKAPFIATLRESYDVPAKELGIEINKEGNIHFLPVEAGFVGADNVSVLIAQEPYKKQQNTLIVDIGTNSEICLCDGKEMYVTSCATGPALEGAQITHGMRAAAGAIEGVTIDMQTLQPILRIIGGQEIPKGICGSAVIDIVEELYRTGIIDTGGKFCEQFYSKYVRLNEHGIKEYVLYFARNEKERDITFTQQDIRAVQLAKAALYSGIQLLKKHSEIEEVDEIVLAGAFGSYINREHALGLGMFPDCDPKKVTVVGNAAGQGAKMALLNCSKRVEAKHIARQVHFVEIAIDADYQNQFAQAMMIPHGEDHFWHNRLQVVGCPQSGGEGDRKCKKNWNIRDYIYQNIEEIQLEDTGTFDNKVMIPFMEEGSLAKGKCIHMMGPFSTLASLIDPMILYRRDVNEDKLSRIMDKIVDTQAQFIQNQIANGCEVITMIDPISNIELVGKDYYEKYCGKPMQKLLLTVHKDLKCAVVQLCGKVSYAMEQCDLITVHPYRMDDRINYEENVNQIVGNRKVRIVGNRCIMEDDMNQPLLYSITVKKRQ